MIKPDKAGKARSAAQDRGPCQRVGEDPSSAPRGASANSGNPLKGSARVPSAAQVQDGWTPLQFYGYIVRNFGLPSRFSYDPEVREWYGEAPFTKPVPQSILDLLEAQGV